MPTARRRDRRLADREIRDRSPTQAQNQAEAVDSRQSPVILRWPLRQVWQAEDVGRRPTQLRCLLYPLTNELLPVSDSLSPSGVVDTVGALAFEAVAGTHDGGKGRCVFLLGGTQFEL